MTASLGGEENGVDENEDRGGAAEHPAEIHGSSGAPTKGRWASGGGGWKAGGGGQRAAARGEVFGASSSVQASRGIGSQQTAGGVGLSGAGGWVASCFDRDCPAPWLDDAGHRIEAHGGGLLQPSFAAPGPGSGGVVGNGTWYWYGESAKVLHPTLGFGYSEAINCYSAPALGGPWRFEGPALRGSAVRGAEDLPEADRPFILERPKVLFNRLTNKYVMWFHLDAAEALPASQVTEWHRKKGILYKYIYRRAGVAVSSSPCGPFKFLHALLPDGEKSLDLQLFQVLECTRRLDTHTQGGGKPRKESRGRQPGARLACSISH